MSKGKTKNEGWDRVRYPLEPLFAYLEGPAGCDFREDPSSPDGMTWRCDHTHRLTRAWLKAHNYPVTAVMHYCEETGGCCCDCEVLLNTSRHYFGEEG